MVFDNRVDAGRKLAAALSKYRDESCAIFALPRGGVPVGAEIAAALHAPLDLLLVRKIGVPYHPELAMGAVVDGGTPIVVRNDQVIRDSRTSESVFSAICAKELAEIERRRSLYLHGRQPLDPKGRVAIVVDDGIATGATMRAALRATRMRKPKRLVLAVPVATRDTIESLRSEVDEVVCLSSPDDFGAVGYYYRDFAQTGDDEVVALLARPYARAAG
ncbi:MAG: phosphoribosyltransferase [Rhizomicrobium sp.]